MEFIFIEPSDAGVLIKHDSGDEGKGDTVNNLSQPQLTNNERLGDAENKSRTPTAAEVSARVSNLPASKSKSSLPSTFRKTTDYRH